MDGHARTESESENASVCALCEKRVSTGRFPYLRGRSKAWILGTAVVGSPQDLRVNVNPYTLHAFRSRSDFGPYYAITRLGIRLPMIKRVPLITAINNSTPIPCRRVP